MGGIGVAMQAQLKWLLVNETCTFKSMAHKLELKVKIPRKGIHPFSSSFLPWR